MDITTIGIKNKSENAVVNKKITIKFFKEGRTSRTYVIGLENFLEYNEAKNLMDLVKKKLGTSLYVKCENDCEQKICEYGFQGNHIEKVVAILIEKMKINKDSFMF